MNMKQTIAIACKNAGGDSDFFITEVVFNQAELDDGTFYEMAIANAEEEGYGGPFICYDEIDQQHLFRVASYLTQTEG